MMKIIFKKIIRFWLIFVFLDFKKFFPIKYKLITGLLNIRVEVKMIKFKKLINNDSVAISI